MHRPRKEDAGPGKTLREDVRTPVTLGDQDRIPSGPRWVEDGTHVTVDEMVREVRRFPPRVERSYKLLEPSRWGDGNETDREVGDPQFPQFSDRKLAVGPLRARSEEGIKEVPSQPPVGGSEGFPVLFGKFLPPTPREKRQASFVEPVTKTVGVAGALGRNIDLGPDPLPIQIPLRGRGQVREWQGSLRRTQRATNDEPLDHSARVYRGRNGSGTPRRSISSVIPFLA